MANPSWILLLFTFASLLLTCFTPAAAQLSPELDKALAAIRRKEKGLSDFNNFIADQGLNYKRGIDLLANKEELLERLNEKLSELLANGKAAIQESVSGKRYYTFTVPSDEDGDDSTKAVMETCLDHTLMAWRDTINGEDYALRMAASQGAPPENGVYTGQGKGIGDIWLCSTAKQNKSADYPPFDGMYCFADIPDTGIGWGECWPNTCTAEEVTTITWFIWVFILQTPPFYYHECQEPKPWSPADIGFTCGLAFFGLLVVCGTLYDIFLQSFVLQRMRRKITDQFQKATDNVYENVDAAEAQTSDIATTSADGEEVHETTSRVMEKGAEVTEEAVEKLTSEDAGEEAKVTPAVVAEVASQLAEHGAKVNGGFEANEHPPPYTKTSSFVLEDPDAGRQKQTNKGHLGWAILHATMMSFSAVNNGRKLLNAKRTKNTMGVLNGLRVISMWWIILGHTCLFYIGRILNPYQSLGYLDSIAILAITNAGPSVDTFFVLSGFLVTFLSLKQMASKQLKSVWSWAIFYFHRWWRLTPIYMAAMGIWALLMPHFGQGVMTDGLYDFIHWMCRKQWWTHPLYINNLYPWPNVQDDSCMGWSWYLANDMQFFIISPLFLIILYKNGKAGIALITAIMLVSLGSLFGLNWYYGLTINDQKSYNDHTPDPPNADITYTKPYTRIPPYLAGMVLGYAMFKLQGKKLKIPLPVVLLGWIVALGILWIVVYGLWFPYQNEKYVPQATAVMYLSFHRLAWGIAICWIIFACLQGYGGPIGVLLEWNFWIPMARLTYGAYLLHPAIIYSKIFTDQVLQHITYVSLAYLYVGNIVFSYVAAFILSLAIEGPTLGIEKVMFGKFKRS